MKEWSQMAKEQWDQFAADWHQRSENMWERGSRKTILPLFTRYVRPEHGPVLDAGCGDGYASCKLARSGYEVTGVDIAGEMIRLAYDRANGRAENRIDDRVNDRANDQANEEDFRSQLSVQFQTGDISNLPFSDNYFSGILCINVTEFTPSPLDALRELHRLLKPDGILLLGILGPTAGPRGHSYRRLYGEATFQNTMMPWEAKQLAGENGFVLVEEEPVFKEGVPAELASRLSVELQESLSFLTLFVLRKM
ncbi:class I SAM-dependent methyltransferase [Brevibacillus composti]|uniref:Class I SAM-dependent methyltransferase n=1 Tax=Brevibacillus composti TaxID=2796470 RepID=A0A7T5EMQ7_9BACL|nr:class I SAM-dependent methyltransferase [Brevibacillus composti]QQE75460.1 class I SAM-dependent methyltransferase [Brevibacillus composti]QUO42486.1 class I SAM-dependent methyltransferase [Brevibacillus composti]